MIVTAHRFGAPRCLLNRFLSLAFLLLPLLTIVGSRDVRAQTAADGSSAEAQSDEAADLKRRAAAIARQTMSPFCPGRTLADCPSPNATTWRQDIRQMLAEGMSAAEIQKVLEARAGGNLSGIPNRRSSYILPLALALGAAALLIWVLARFRGVAERKKKTEKKKDVEQLGVDDARLEEELALEGEDDDDV
ncbi:MAG: cytochrome c-type biogenesis protein CcmH [Polyangiaceae bacterium]|nr:cytochrome c-type biogenesis protein CcmH [Polyangiaceae bacterium]